MIPTKKEWTEALIARHGRELYQRFTFTIIAPPYMKTRETSDLEVSRDGRKSLRWHYPNQVYGSKVVPSSQPVIQAPRV